MGVLKYDARMCKMVSVRMTPMQVNSVTAIAHAMSLTVGDTLRAAFDEWTEDLDEPAVFTRRVRMALGPTVSKPRRGSQVLE